MAAAPLSADTGGAFVRFVVLYAALFTAFGALSPFLPAFLNLRGLGPEMLGLTLAAGTAVRLAAGPVAGRLADRLAAPKLVLGAVTIASALACLGYLPARGTAPLLLVSLVQSAALAPVVPLADTLCLASSVPFRRLARRHQGFDYGWVRGTGSAAFILGVVMGGRIIARLGFPSVIILNAALLAAAACVALGVPNRIEARSGVPAESTRGSIAALLACPAFRRLLLVAALIEGSHAMHDNFAVIRWREAGIDPSTIGLLWSEGVVGEIAVFFLLGRPLLIRLGPARSALLAGVAGVVRWAVLARATGVTAIALVEPLHGLTFALLHLTCMHLIRETVPASLAATAQTVYGTVGIGVTTALLTLCSGLLYAHLGAGGFWVMSALCALALPTAARLRPATVETNR